MIHETKLLGCRLQMLQTKNARTFSSDHAQLEDLAEHLSSQFPAYAKDLKSWITAGKQGPPPQPKSVTAILCMKLIWSWSAKGNQFRVAFLS